jgi:WD40 repeat protein
MYTFTPIPTTACLQDDRYLASRGMDATLKVWDLRLLKQPLAALGNLPTNYATTACKFSPDARLLITGTAAEAGGGEGGGGQVVFVDSADWSIVRRVGMPAHVAGLDWHPRINQIFVGIGRCCLWDLPTTVEAGATAGSVS